MNTELTISEKTKQHIAHYLEACDPLLMMTLLMDFAGNQRHELTDNDYRQVAACHNLLAAIFRNE